VKKIEKCAAARIKFATVDN